MKCELNDLSQLIVSDPEFGLLSALQDVIEALAQMNHRRVFGGDEEVAEEETEREGTPRNNQTQ